ncbi:MAG: HlyD family secretion protein [Sphingomonadales bacterium]|nr:HlyD family secretion protein [Sphingomonadales bacterium]MDE2170734.1 HlyD family secretion protein [Sphingomonadales bacterium]
MQMSLSSPDSAPIQRAGTFSLRRPLLIAVPVLIALAGGAAWLAAEPYAVTDDATIQTTKGSINARVAGQVVEIAVRDNQAVRKGQLLFRIDPQPYEIAVAQAQAHLAATRLQIEGLKATYRQQMAALKSAQDTADFDTSDFNRKSALLASDVTSRATWEQAETALKVSRQGITAAQQQVANTVAALNGNPDIAPDRHPAVREAQAALDKAKLDLAYTRVTAPEDGIVTKVEDLQPGDYVTGGTAMFAILSTRHLWVEANFRETDLTHMRPGQHATIDVDAYPGTHFSAHVVSMSPGTGSQFSLLPPENATGNWVKVVQRLPVRLELDGFDAAHPLYSGISVTAQVDTGWRRTWAHPLAGEKR